MLTRSLAPYRAFAPLASLRDEVDRLMEGFTRQMELEPLFGRGEALFMPHLDVIENDKVLKVTVELPGLDEKDVEVELTRNALILRGEKLEVKEEKEDNYYRQERRFGAFHREIPLPWEIDASKVKADATFKKGLLTVTVPKPKGMPAASKKIPITAT